MKNWKIIRSMLIGKNRSNVSKPNMGFVISLNENIYASGLIGRIDLGNGILTPTEIIKRISDNYD